MCEVCRFDKSGDIPEDREEFINHLAGSVSGNDIYLRGMICNYPYYYLDVFVEVGGNVLVSKTVSINYCPICGRKLRGD